MPVNASETWRFRLGFPYLNWNHPIWHPKILHLGICKSSCSFLFPRGAPLNSPKRHQSINPSILHGSGINLPKLASCVSMTWKRNPGTMWAWAVCWAKLRKGLLNWKKLWNFRGRRMGEGERCGKQGCFFKDDMMEDVFFWCPFLTILGKVSKHPATAR